MSSVIAIERGIWVAPFIDSQTINQTPLAEELPQDYDIFAESHLSYHGIEGFARIYAVDIFKHPPEYFSNCHYPFGEIDLGTVIGQQGIQHHNIPACFNLEFHPDTLQRYKDIRSNNARIRINRQDYSVHFRRPSFTGSQFPSTGMVFRGNDVVDTEGKYGIDLILPWNLDNPEETQNLYSAVRLRLVRR